MKIKYLGTGASEGIPSLFCKCKICEDARKNKGRDIRSRSQALIDGKLLVDFPPDTFMHIVYGDLDLPSIHTCIVTHSHSDHLYTSDIWARKQVVSPVIPDEGTPLTFYATSSGYEKIKAVVEGNALDIEKRVEAVLIKAFEPFCAQGYDITPVRADHTENTDPVLFIIEKDGKTIFYGNDTGRFPEKTMEYLKNCGKHFDLISLDCTNGFNSGDRFHMNFKACCDMRDFMRGEGLCDDKTICVLTHLCHNCGGDRTALEAEAERLGFIAAYDGMEVEI
jgi:phosphoribosyl 1,2-cyclic phosphate phosphodiesterase